jgi:hypothetical protein
VECVKISMFSHVHHKLIYHKLSLFLFSFHIYPDFLNCMRDFLLNNLRRAHRVRNATLTQVRQFFISTRNKGKEIITEHLLLPDTSMALLSYMFLTMKKEFLIFTLRKQT